MTIRNKMLKCKYQEVIKKKKTEIPLQDQECENVIYFDHATICTCGHRLLHI